MDLYSKEISSQYGEVVWYDQGIWDLPADLVSRFAGTLTHLISQVMNIRKNNMLPNVGKVMAITGYEADQVDPVIT